MGWLQRRAHQTLRTAHTHGWGIALDALDERRRKPLRRYQRRMQAQIDRMGHKPLLHKGRKPHGKSD